MTTRIALILTVLLSAGHSPFCLCAGSGGRTSGDRTVDATAVGEESRPCCHDRSDSGSRPVQDDCCCRIGRQAMLADAKETGILPETTTADLIGPPETSRTGLVPVFVQRQVPVRMPVSAQGGRALLMRTGRLLI